MKWLGWYIPHLAPLPQIRWNDMDVLRHQSDHETAIRLLLRQYKKLPSDECSDYLDYLAERLGTGRYVSDNSNHWLTWSMLRTMQDDGMTIGGHTVNHPVLANLDFDEQQYEISECLRRLSEELGKSPRQFSYPVGGSTSFNEATRSCLREAGVQYAFSYDSGFNRFGRIDPFNVRRSAIELDVTTKIFNIRIAAPQWLG